MKIFLDSANLEEVRKLADIGICDGVTTNPTLVAKQGEDFKSVVTQIARIVRGPVSAEVVATEFAGMMAEAKVLAALDPNVVIKLPLTPDGLKACGTLSAADIKTNVTLCFQASQALLAAKVGATYISPFVGRLDDVSSDGMQVVRDIRSIYDRYGFKTQILAASIRHPAHVVEAALAGADVVTAPFATIMQLFKHPLTDKGLDAFLADWQASGQKSILG
jgi:transaldolase